jgi:hypothetical protein
MVLGFDPGNAPNSISCVREGDSEPPTQHKGEQQLLLVAKQNMTTASLYSTLAALLPLLNLGEKHSLHMLVHSGMRKASQGADSDA